MGKFRNRKAAGKDEVTGEMVKGGSEMAMYWIWRLCNMVFKSGIVPEDWRPIVTDQMYKAKGERTECFIDILVSRMIGKIYAYIY